MSMDGSGEHSTEQDLARINALLEETEEFSSELLNEALSISRGNPKTTSEISLYRHFDEMWRDLRATFRLLDKVGKGVADGVKASASMKTIVVAANLEVRRQVKTIQKDLAKFRRDSEREIKAIKKANEGLLTETKEFKKMVDLYLNPPKQMGPTSRRTSQPIESIETMVAKGIEKGLRALKEKK